MIAQPRWDRCSHLDFVPNPALLTALDREIDEEYLATSAAASAAVRVMAMKILLELGLPGGLQRSTPSAVAAFVGVHPERVFAFGWLLHEGVQAGILIETPNADGRLRYGPAPPEQVRAACARLNPRPEGLGASLPMLEHVARHYADYLRGATSGPYVLLRGQGLSAWEGYFSDDNPLYAVHNRIGAEGVAAALATLDRPARVVELGSGAGGGTAALLGRCLDLFGTRLASLVLTDISPSFLVRTLERLPVAGLPVERRKLDFNRPLPDQGFAAGSIDVLFAVNAVHNSTDLPATLRHLREALADDGVLVLSESVCGPGEQVHQDFVFNLLAPTHEVDPDARAYSRFRSTEEWRPLLAEAGFATEIYRNSRGPELAMLALARPA